MSSGVLHAGLVVLLEEGFGEGAEEVCQNDAWVRGH